MSRGMATIAIACLAGLVLVGCSRRVAPPPPSTTVIPEAEREYVVENSKKAGKKEKREQPKKRAAEKKKGQQSETKKDPKEDKEKSHAVSLKKANELCRKESEVRGIRSIAAIFRRRSREKAYAKCMQRKGFNVAE
jgi:hypothetical protein